ncbi:MAG: P-type conjugative transfer protein TrbG, partial [Pseudomonadota bacterium]
MLRLLLATSALALTTACATTELDPIDPNAFVAATPIEDDYDRPVEIVETAVALPLPGQMMPVGASVTTNPDGSVTRRYTRTVSREAVP